MFIEYKSGEHGQNRDKKTPNQEQFQSLEGLVKTPVFIFEEGPIYDGTEYEKREKDLSFSYRFFARYWLVEG